MNLRVDCIEVKCNTEKEWVDLQKYLFSIGIQWPTGIEVQYTSDGIFPRYLYLNFIDEYLCWGTDRDTDDDERIKFNTTANIILRKSKLKKIDEEYEI